MRLYHFLKTCHAVDDVAKSRIKISLFQDVNDPWELLPFDLSDVRDRHTLESLKSRLSEEQAFVGMRRNWFSPLMWAHYAEKHQGVALGFDVADSFCNEIHYVSKPYRIPPAPPDNIGLRILRDRRRLIDALLITKLDEWSYEKEVRAFTNKDGSNTENGIEFYPFSSDFALREVILGEKCPLSIAQFRASAAGMDASVRVIRARRAVNDFCLEEDPKGS